MSKFLGPCLGFAGLCLLSGAMVGVADWAVCRSHGGGDSCRSARVDAMAALTGAANVALGVAIQREKNDKPQ